MIVHKHPSTDRYADRATPRDLPTTPCRTGEVCLLLAGVRRGGNRACGHSNAGRELGLVTNAARICGPPLGLSFYFGCRHLVYVESTLFANAALLKVEAGEHPEVGRHPQLMAAANEGIRSAIESNSNCASRFARLQFRFLVLGAISYLGWHVYEMFLRAVS